MTIIGSLRATRLGWLNDLLQELDHHVLRHRFGCVCRFVCAEWWRWS